MMPGLLLVNISCYDIVSIKDNINIYILTRSTQTKTTPKKT